MVSLGVIPLHCHESCGKFPLTFRWEKSYLRCLTQIPTAMTINPQLPVPGPEAGNSSKFRTPQEAQEHAQHKALKKERKNERLRSFFGWCWGFQSMGGSF